MSSRPSWKPIAVRTIELTQPLQPLRGLEHYEGVRVFVTWQEIPIGWFEVTHSFEPEIPEPTLAKEIAQLDCQPPPPLPGLPAKIGVSIVIATCDRPDTLRRCLQTLLDQTTDRNLEIIVVDNRPRSGLTKEVVTEFQEAKQSQSQHHLRYVAELRAGACYARNTGILASSGEIIVSVDDDVVIPPFWLEHLLAPFNRPEVMGVTGNILPLELETRSQQVFEIYGEGGLGRGFRRFETDRAWFDQSRPVVRTWLLGATANAAFRASIFAHPGVGLMEETLGPGMPSGAGEDIYLFYKILKAGGVMVYEPTAHVWHQHRRNMPELCQQIYCYSKGFVAYQLTTLLQDGDYRALQMLLRFLPRYQIERLFKWAFGDRVYPIELIIWEILGNLVGGWALWSSHQRVRTLGRSRSTVPARVGVGLNERSDIF
jgi:O-antigen biosynthesis protein